MGSFDRPRHGWEGLNNGGEIYGNNYRDTNNIDDEFNDEFERHYTREEINAVIAEIELKKKLEEGNLDFLSNDDENSYGGRSR